jgi:hypothetical protein
MLSPSDIIGQKVWLEVPRDLDYPLAEPIRVKAVLTQPTSPPWFYARYEDAPRAVREAGQWISLYDAQQAVLLHPVFEETYLDEEDWVDEYADEENELNLK